MVSVTIKHGKDLYENILLNTSESVFVFKSQLYELTKVPTERQKLMAKGLWKGMLKEDMQFTDMDFTKTTSSPLIMLMGSAESCTAPLVKTIFMEDMNQEEMAGTGVVLPAGLQNLGNVRKNKSFIREIRRPDE